MCGCVHGEDVECCFSKKNNIQLNKIEFWWVENLDEFQQSNQMGNQP